MDREALRTLVNKMMGSGLTVYEKFELARGVLSLLTELEEATMERDFAEAGMLRGEAYKDVLGRAEAAEKQIQTFVLAIDDLEARAEKAEAELKKAEERGMYWWKRARTAEVDLAALREIASWSFDEWNEYLFTQPDALHALEAYLRQERCQRATCKPCDVVLTPQDGSPGET